MIAAASSIPGDLAVRVGDTRLQIVDKASGSPIPDGDVAIISADGSVSNVRSESGLIRKPSYAGQIRITSTNSPPMFEATNLEGQASRVEVVPLALIEIGAANTLGAAVPIGAYDVTIRVIDGAEVARCVRESSGDRDRVRLLLETAKSSPLSPSRLMPTNSGCCILCTGKGVVRVEPSHENWYGAHLQNAGKAPSVGGGLCPVSTPVTTVPGGVCRVTVVVGRPGAIEVSLGPWKVGKKAVLTLRRAGLPGRDTASRSWLMVATNEVALGGAAVVDRLEFIDLMPGEYKIDALLWRSDRDLEASLLWVRVTEGRTSYVDILGGVGNKSIVLVRPSNAQDARLALFLRVPVPPADVSADFPDWSQVIMVDQWGAGQLNICGLLGVKGTLTALSSHGASSVDIDLAARGRYEVP